MNLKWYLLAVLFLLTFAYEYVKHVLLEGHEPSYTVLPLLFFAAIIVPPVLWAFSKLEKQGKELAEREEKLRSFLESTGDAVFETNAEGYFTFMNQAGAEMCALSSPRDVIGRHGTEFWAEPREREAYLAALKEKGYVRQYPMLARRANGELAYWELTSNALKDEEGSFAGIRGICRDVTERKKLEEQLREYAGKLEEKVEERMRELRESEERFRGLVETSADAIISANEEGMITLWNKAAEEIFGYIEGEALGKPLTLIMPEKYRELHIKGRHRYLKTGEGRMVGRTVELEGLRKDGHKFPVELSLSDQQREGHHFFTAVVRDMTRRKTLEEAIRVRGEKLAMLNDMVAEITKKLDYQKVLELTAEKAAELIEAETVAIPVVSEDYATITYSAAYGRNAKKLLGGSKPLKKRSICGWVIRNKKPFYSKDIARDRREVEEVKRQLNLRAAISAPLMYKGRVFGGITALNKLGGRAFTKEDLQLLSILASNAAIALRNAVLMEEIKSYASKLERSNELKDLFADIMRHDLLNPVSVIKGFSEMMSMDRLLGEHRKSLEKIRKSAEKIEAMIESASKYAKLEDAEKLDLEERDAAAIIGGVVGDFEPLLKAKDISVEYRHEGKALALVNPLIEDVFSNLLSNAIKYSPEGSDIAIELEDLGGEWCIAVKDRGEGIPDDMKEEVFERFKRADKGGVKGTGLGLAIVKRVMELHNGSAWVEDNPEGGSIFYVTIPKKAVKKKFK